MVSGSPRLLDRGRIEADRWHTVSLMLIESVTHHEAPAA